MSQKQGDAQLKNILQEESKNKNIFNFDMTIFSCEFGEEKVMLS